jgi:hypothetical protein
MSYLSRRCREIREEEERRDQPKWIVGIDATFQDPHYGYWSRYTQADIRRALEYPYSWRGRGG